MKLELKNIKVAQHLSEETTAYSATLYVDGKKTADVSNRGHGDMTLVYPHESQRQLDPVHTYVETLPDFDLGDGYGTVPMTLDLWCDIEVQKHLVLKKIKRDMKTKLLFVKRDEVGTGAYSYFKHQGRVAECLTYARSKYPDAVFSHDDFDAFFNAVN